MKTGDAPVAAVRWRDMPRKPPKSGVLSFKAPAELISALDTLAEQMAAEKRGLKVTRTEVVMVLLWEGIERRKTKDQK